MKFQILCTEKTPMPAVAGHEPISFVQLVIKQGKTLPLSTLPTEPPHGRMILTCTKEEADRFEMDRWYDLEISLADGEPA